MTEYKLVVVGGKYLQWHLDYLGGDALQCLFYSWWRGQVCFDDPADPESLRRRVRSHDRGQL